VNSGGAVMAKYTTDEILRQLDDDARVYHFPMLDNAYVYPGDVRLTAYRDERRWAILIQTLGYLYRAGFPEGIYPDIYAAGNCLTEGEQPSPFSCASDPDKEYITDIPDELAEVFIRGKAVPLPRDPAVYRSKGIALDDIAELHGEHILRVLLPEHREELLATEDELRRFIPADLPFFLCLESWHHPDLADDELPSGNSTFKELAAALVHGEPNRFRLKRKPNTQWKNWPRGGTL